MESISKYIEGSLSGNTEYLTEAVASRKTGKYIQFPEEPDKDKMIAFLESNGFSKDAYTGKSYWVGSCNPSNNLTFWTKFTDYDRPRVVEFFYRFKYCEQQNRNDFTVIETYNRNVRALTMKEFKKEVFEYFGI